jgi:hypothetical protein
MDCIYNSDGIIYESVKKNIIYSVTDKLSMSKDAHTVNQENNKNIQLTTQYVNMSVKDSSDIHKLKKLLLNHSC